jgi:hypothetical protein
MWRETGSAARNAIFVVIYHGISYTTESPDSWQEGAAQTEGRPFGGALLLLRHNKDETP